MTDEADDRLADLDRQAVALLSGGRPDVAVAPHLDDLLACDFRDHPWAQLVVGAALNDFRDDRCTTFVHSSLRRFQRDQESQGIGYAYSVLGYIALGRGQLTDAAQWLHLARQHLQEDSPGDAVNLAHIGLGAYQRGNVQEAISITEEALALARIQGSRRHEGVACLYLSFFGVITGDFARVRSLLDVAEQTYLELPDPLERFEYPLVLAGRGVLASLRGEPDLAESGFSAALSIAAEINIPWYAAISLALRAEFTAHVYPQRSLADARNALEQLTALNDAWWQTWAWRAQGVAAREAGDVQTSVHLLRRLLDKDLNPLERGLTLLALGQSLTQADGTADPVLHLEEARELLESVGARYWVFRCWLALSTVGPATSGARKRAVALADEDPAYRRLLEQPSDLRICVMGDAGVWRGSRKLSFATRNAELAVYSLALAGPAGLHEDVLIERLWPNAPADRAGARVRTVLWQIRQTLGPDADRVERRAKSIRLRLEGAFFDLDELRRRAEAAVSQTAVGQDSLRSLELALAQPMLIAWQYEPWIESEVDRNAELLAALQRRREVH